jgi:hypothetical protein
MDKGKVDRIGMAKSRQQYIFGYPYDTNGSTFFFRVFTRQKEDIKRDISLGQ